MTYQTRATNFDLQSMQGSIKTPNDPRGVMFDRVSPLFQPFLTWLTAKPAPGEPMKDRSPLFFVRVAAIQTIGGIVMTCAALGLLNEMPGLAMLCALLSTVTLTTSGLGLLQVVIFHHCSHGTVFRHRPSNRTVGRLISAILLFKHFDAYKAGHMMHHSNNKLLTEEDEFADFVFGMCGLRPGAPKARLWLRVIASLASPSFHVRFLMRRVRGAWRSGDRAHDLIGIGTWTGLAAVAALVGRVDMFFMAWVLPTTILLQIATVFRILCEHRFPDPDLIRQRGRDFACHATAGVFPGAMPPRERAKSLRGARLWAAWWANMLTLQLLVRVIVLVGDAPCHDYHHRRPASARWTSYIQARQLDMETNASGYGVAYQECWGLFAAVDENLASLARSPVDLVL